MKPDYQPIASKNENTKWIELCAWCDPSKKLTKEYISLGYQTSHGICLRHLNEVLEEYKNN
jgi:hypothetical protein